jgi:outer membrane protein assembly factor BamB
MKKTPEGTWSAAWDTRNVPYGQHTVMVSTSGVGYRPLSATVKVTVDNHTPSITVIAPAEGATVGGKVTLKAQVNDLIPGTTMTYTAGDAGTPVPMTLNLATGYFEARWDTSALPEGDLTLTFRSDDPSHKTATATRTVTIVPPPPLPPQPSGDFTHFRGDLEGRAYTADEYGTTFTSLWTNTSVHSTRLALYNGILYATSTTSPGKLSALNATTGKVLWELQLDNTPGPVAVGPNAAYVTPYNSKVVAVKPDGSILWRSTIVASSPPILTPAGVFVGDIDGKVYALDPLTGATLWSVQTPTYGYGRDTMPVYADGKLYMPAYSSTPVIDVATRQVAFTIAAGSDDGLLWHNGTVYLVGGTVGAYNGETGERLWVSQASRSFDSPPAIGHGILVVGESASAPKLYGLDAATGEVRWSSALDTYGTSYGKPVIAGSRVYMGAYFKGLKVFDLETGAYQTTLLSNVEVHNTPLPYGGVLYVPNAQFGIYALKKQ